MIERKIQRDHYPEMDDERAVMHAACGLAKALVTPEDIPVGGNGRPTHACCVRVLTQMAGHDAQRAGRRRHPGALHRRVRRQ